MSDFLTGIKRRARELDRRIVFPEGTDPRVIAAVVRLHRNRWARPVVIGGAAVREALAAAGLEPGAVEVVDPRRDERTERLLERLHDRRGPRGMSRAEAADRVHDPLLFAALLVGAGEADGGVAGASHPSGEVLRACLWSIGPAAGIQTVSSSFYMTVGDFRGRGDEVLTFTDAGVVPNPSADQLADIALAATRARPLVVGDAPSVAFLSYSTVGSAEGPSVDRVRDALGRFRERAPDVPVVGEVQADAALISSVAARKMPGERNAGRANVLVFPNLDAGNIAYKLVQRLADAGAVGPIVQGLARPFNDLSRGADAEDIVNAACITALMSTESIP